jgi:DNA-binding response OmpR family regulator
VALVESDALLREMLMAVLARAGYVVFAASSAGEGLAVIRTRRPDVIICDVVLPQFACLKLARIVRSHRSYDAIPIVLLGEVAMLPPASAFYDATLPHPLRMQTLLSLLRRVLVRASSCA